MKIIKLTLGKETLVDDEDFQMLSTYKWRACKSKVKYYARCLSKGSPKTRKYIHMSRLLLNCPPDMFVDHIDGNSLNNQKSNLRIVTNLQNCQNKRPDARKHKSGFKGVFFDPQRQKFRARIIVNKKMISLGQSENPEDAAKLYDSAAIKYFGEFANTNFPREKVI